MCVHGHTLCDTPLLPVHARLSMPNVHSIPNVLMHIDMLLLLRASPVLQGSAAVVTTAKVLPWILSELALCSPS